MVPLIRRHAQIAQCAHGDERIVSDHRNAAGAAVEAVHGIAAVHARHAIDPDFLAFELAAERRAHQHAGVKQGNRCGCADIACQIGGHDVDTKAQAAVELGRGFDAAHALADQRERCGVLELGVFGMRQLTGQRDEFAERRRAARRRVSHVAGLCYAFIDRHRPFMRRSRAKHFARRGTCFAHGHPQVADTRGAACDHRAEVARHAPRQVTRQHRMQALVVLTIRQSGAEVFAVDVCGIDERLHHAHLRPVRAQFIGQQHGRAGMDALPHLGLAHDDRHAVIRADDDPAVQRHRAIGRR